MAFSKLMEKINAREFVFTGKLSPVNTCDLSSIIQEAREMAPHVIAVNIADGPLGDLTVSPLAVSGNILKETGVEPILNLTTRDSSKLGLASSLLGAHVLGVRNILALTGDHPNLGNMPESKPVYDLDSATLILLARELVDKGTINGIKINNPPKIHIGGAVNPNCSPSEPEIIKIGRKKEAGCEFLLTQVVFDIDKTIEFLQAIQKYKMPVLLGIFPMKNYTIAKGFDEKIKEVDVPKDLLAKLKEFSENISDKNQQRENYDSLNVEFFTPMINELKSKGLIAGLNVMGLNYSRIFPKLINATK